MNKNQVGEYWKKHLTLEDIPSDHMRALAECCGIPDAITLMEKLPGIEIYIPSKCKKMLDLQYIKNTYTGHNISAIAIHLNLSRSIVEKIVKQPLKVITDKEIFFNQPMQLVVANCGRDLAVRLIRNRANLLSDRIYIPGTGFLKLLTRKFIQEKFTGSNAQELALQCGVSDRFIRKAVADMYSQKHSRSKSGGANA